MREAALTSLPVDSGQSIDVANGSEHCGVSLGIKLLFFSI